MPAPSAGMATHLLARIRAHRVLAGALAAALLAGSVAAVANWGPFADKPPAPGAAPWEYSLPAWDQLLGGDVAYTSSTYAALEAAPSGFDKTTSTTLADLAFAVAQADLTARGRGAWPGYWPPAATTTTAPAERCSSVSRLASSPARLPVTAPGAAGKEFAKVLVAYAGECGKERLTLTNPGSTYVYLTRQDKGWVPVRSWDVPAAPDRTDPQSATEPADWQLKTLGPCGVIDGDVLRARTVVADAFEAMCTAAAKDNVVLVAESAYRTRAQQAKLFAEAVKFYGTPDKARQWVSYADKRTCQSRACAGLSVGVEPDNAAVTWLRAVVGCSVDGKASALAAGQKACATGSVPVLRSQLYGFVAPADRIPGYLEFVLPVGESSTSAPDCAPAGVPVPNMVASIFRCRLAREGVAGPDAEAVVAQALVVSRCSSQWNAAAQLFAGRYARQPNPADGRTYSETGVFALRAPLADTGWVHGGRAALTDPVANINAAASLWLSTRGWEQFPCAVGTDPQLKVAPSLPAYGGPPLPDWATKY